MKLNKNIMQILLIVLLLLIIVKSGGVLGPPEQQQLEYVHPDFPMNLPSIDPNDLEEYIRRRDELREEIEEGLTENQPPPTPPQPGVDYPLHRVDTETTMPIKYPQMPMQMPDKLIFPGIVKPLPPTMWDKLKDYLPNWLR